MLNTEVHLFASGPPASLGSPLATGLTLRER